MFENMFEKALVLQYFWTNLGPILVKLIVEHIIRPQNNKAWLFKFRIDIVIIGLTMTMTRNVCLRI